MRYLMSKFTSSRYVGRRRGTREQLFAQEFPPVVRNAEVSR